MARNSGLPVVGVGSGYAQTVDIGGSRFPIWGASAFNPMGMTASTTATTYATPSVPAVYGSQPSQYTGASSSMLASMDPWSTSASSLPLVIVGLVVSVFLIWHLYYRDRRK